MRKIVVSMLGHKDHGKSTLIGRLLYETKAITEDRIREAQNQTKTLLGKDELEYAFLLDSFEEEREGGFTLDTTRAQFKKDGVLYELIDVPGHKELVKNMLTGASNADSAMLLVSVKPGEGIQDETKLHVFLAKMLGIPKLTVVVNKIDLAGYSQEAFETVKADLSVFLKGIGYSPEYFIPISATAGDNISARSENMPWYTGPTVMDVLVSTPLCIEAVQTLLLPVQDVFEGIVLGRLEGGSVKSGETIRIQPGLQTAQITKMLVGGETVEAAETGQNLGLHLMPTVDVKRGQVISSPATPYSEGTVVEADVFCLAQRLQPEKFPFRAGTYAGIATLESIQYSIDPHTGATQPAQSLSYTQAGRVRIKLPQPIVAEPFEKVPKLGRFVLSAGGHVAAVGVVRRVLP